MKTLTQHVLAHMHTDCRAVLERLERHFIDSTIPSPSEVPEGLDHVKLSWTRPGRGVLHGPRPDGRTRLKSLLTLGCPLTAVPTITTNRNKYINFQFFLK